MNKKENLKIIKSKKRLYLSLLQLIKEKKFEEINISDICKNASINRSTFYDHFTDKYELLSSLIKDLTKKLERKLNKIKKNTNQKNYYTNIVELLLNHLEENFLIYSSVIENNKAIINYTIMEVLYKSTERYYKEIDYKSTVPIKILSNYYIGAITATCLLYIEDSKNYSKKRIINNLKKTITIIN